MEPSTPQAPAAPGYIPLRKDSLLSPGGLSSGPSTSPHMMFHQHLGQPLYGVQEDEGSFEDDLDADPGMDVDELGSSKPQVSQPSSGDAPKGTSQKNFVYKLYQMMEDLEAKSYITWGPEGLNFIVTNQEDFARKILSKHFKHSNFSSFVRQLNMYDFHKTNRAPRSQRGTAQHQQWIFSHPKFQQGRPDLLPGIKRKANESGTFPLNGEDQLPTERRASFVSAGLRSPPNGFASGPEARILDLQTENADLKSRIQWLEAAYKSLDAKLNAVIHMVQSRGQQPLSLDAREPSRPTMMASRSMQQQTQDEQFDCGVPSSLGQATSFPHQHGDGLQSSPTDSQSPVTQFHAPETRNTYVPGHSAPPSRQSSAATSVVHSTPGSLSNSLSTALTGDPSSFPQHQSNPVSLQPYAFLGIGGFNTLDDPGTQSFAGSASQGFASVLSPTIAQSQSRVPLGARGFTVARTPAKAGPLATVPLKGPPQDSNGGLYH